MNEEKVKELLEELKDSIDYPKIIVPTFDGSDEEEMDNDKCFNPNQCKVLLDYIKQLQNNWNELKKWLEENKFNDNYESYQVDNYTTYNDILNKMQEMENCKDD